MSAHEPTADSRPPQPRAHGRQPNGDVGWNNDVLPIDKLDFEAELMTITPERAPSDPRPVNGSVIERLRLKDVSVFYDKTPAVKSVSLTIHQGEVLALIGPSGCGKTTLLRTLNRLTELTRNASHSGQILLDGDDTDELVDTELRSRVSMVFQQPNPFPMSIFDNVAFALREQSRRRPRRRELEPLVNHALQRAGLYEEVRGDLERSALRLSGGQQQRLCIARAIAQEPEILLMDEPCSALDPRSTAVIEDLIVQLRKDLAIVVVTHNLQQARRIADRVGFMYLGDLVELGDTEQIFTAPRDEQTREYIAGVFG
jgi:phosphate transport system ATP-binding protein